jgi:hypothetical protein
LVLAGVACASPEQVRGGDDPMLPDLATAGPINIPRTDLGAPDLVSGGGDDLATTGGEDLAQPGSADLSSGGPTDLSMSGAPDMTMTGGGDMTMCTPPTAGGLCDTSPQCGCPGTHNCSVTNFTTGDTSCVTAGTTPNYAACSGSGAGVCMIGSACVSGNCKPFCQNNANCTQDHSLCDQIFNGQNPIPGWKACTRTCDPVNPQSSSAPYLPCGAGINCFPDASRASDCIGPTTASGTQGAYCDGASGPDQTRCAPGFICLGDLIGLFYDCYKFCKVGSNADCTGSAAGKTCFSFATKQYAGLAEIGYCDTP